MISKNVKLLIKELLKHAQRDDCFGCKHVLRAMNLDPDKPYEELFKVEDG